MHVIAASRLRWLASSILPMALAWLVPSCSSDDSPAAAPPSADGGGIGEEGGAADGASGTDAGAGADGSPSRPEVCTKTLHLDPAFGNGGIATGAFGQVSSDREDTLLESQRVMPYPDGSLVFSMVGTGMRPVKLTATGQLDATFDATAAMTTLALDYPIVVGAGPNGSVIVGGSRSTGPGQTTGLVGRLTSTGALDTTFGTGGYVLLDHLGPSGAAAYSGVEYVVPLADGRIVVVGMVTHVYMARLTAAGALDTTFGGGAGYVTFGSQYYDQALGLALHDDGSSAVLVYSQNTQSGAPSIYFGSVFRRQSDGAPIASYGDAGAFTSLAFRVDDFGGIWAQPAGYDVVESGGQVRRLDPTGRFSYPFAVHGRGFFHPVTLPSGDLVVVSTQSTSGMTKTNGIDLDRLTATAEPCGAPLHVDLPGALPDSISFTADAASHVYVGIGINGDTGAERGDRAILKLDVDP